jgi:hypothetical protein
MKKATQFLIMLLSVLCFNSCSVVGGIFNVGMDVGIFISVLFIVIILFIVLRLRKK